MRLLIVIAISVFAWIRIGTFSPMSSIALAVSVLAASALARSPLPRVRSWAPIPPVLFLLVLALSHACRPASTSPFVSLEVLGATCLAMHLAAGPSGRRTIPLTLLSKLGLFAAVLFLALIAAEGVRRRSEPLDPYSLEPTLGRGLRRLYAADEELGLVLRPGFQGRFVHPEYRGEHVEINSEGFRDREWPEMFDPGVVGVLLLGDSTLFGMGAEREEMVAARLEAMLAECFPTISFRVYNAGVPSYGPTHELGLLRRVRGRLQPRVCLALFYDGNDLEDCHRQFVEAREAGLHSARLPSEDRTGELREPDLFFATPDATQIPPLWSRTYWARYSIVFRDLDRALSQRLVRLGLVPMTFAYNSELIRSMRRDPDVGIQEDLELTARAVREMSEECRRGGVAFGLVRLPALLQCEPTTFHRILQELGQDPRKFDPREPGASILSDARAHGIPARDLGPALEVGEREQSRFYFREGHPNRAGNVRIAEEMLSLIDEDGLLEAALARLAAGATAEATDGATDRKTR